jgi:hypothetical protein
MDLNHDKQIQSLLCYRYTIGQAGADNNLESFINQSSRQTSVQSTDFSKPRSLNRGPLCRGDIKCATGHAPSICNEQWRRPSARSKIVNRKS